MSKYDAKKLQQNYLKSRPALEMKSCKVTSWLSSRGRRWVDWWCCWGRREASSCSERGAGRTRGSHPASRNLYNSTIQVSRTPRFNFKFLWMIWSSNWSTLATQWSILLSTNLFCLRLIWNNYRCKNEDNHRNYYLNSRLEYNLCMWESHRCLIQSV